MAEVETGTTVVITGPEADVKRIIEVLHVNNVPIIEGYPPKLKDHPDEDAPEDLKIGGLIIDSRGWEKADEAAAEAAKKLRAEISRA